MAARWQRSRVAEQRAEGAHPQQVDDLGGLVADARRGSSDALHRRHRVAALAHRPQHVLRWLPPAVLERILHILGARDLWPLRLQHRERCWRVDRAAQQRALRWRAIARQRGERQPGEHVRGRTFCRGRVRLL